MILSPAVAFLLLSEMTRTGWISFQVLYSRQVVTVDFLGPYWDTSLWILLTVTLGLVVAADVLRQVRQSADAYLLLVILVASVSIFSIAAAFKLVILAIAVGALIYLIDLVGTIPSGIHGWSTVGAKILGVSVALTFAFVLSIVAELAYPGSLRFGGSTLPWLLFKALQLTMAVYHGLDPTVPVLYAILLILPFVLLGTIPYVVGKRPGRGYEIPQGLNSSIALGVTVALFALASASLSIPYIGAGRPMGVDFGWYIDRLRELPEACGACTPASFSYLPILFVGWTFKELFQISPEFAIQLTTVTVAIAAAASAGWFTLQATQDKGTAVLSVLFSLFSIRATVGYFAGLLANWLALAEVFVALGLLIRFLRERNKQDLIAALAVNVLAFATHQETWVVLSLLMLLAGLRCRQALLGSGVVVLALASLALGNAGFVSWKAVQLSGVFASFSLRNPLNFLDNLAVLNEYFAVGLFRDPILLILSILGLIGISFRPVSRAPRFVLLAWTALAGLFVLFVGPPFAWRAVYEIPYEILAALGASVIWRACENPALGHPLSDYVPTTVLVVLCLATIANGIRAILTLAVL
jgi:hypothetical protein